VALAGMAILVEAVVVALELQPELLAYLAAGEVVAAEAEALAEQAALDISKSLNIIEEVIVTTLVPNGDSNTRGGSVSASFGARIAAARGWSVANLAIDGGMLPDTADAVMALVIQPDTKSYVAHGVNHARLSGGDGGKLAWFKKLLMAQIAHMGIVHADKMFASNPGVFVSTAQPWEAGPYGYSKSTNCGGARIIGDMEIRNERLYVCMTASDTWAGSKMGIFVDDVLVYESSPCAAGNLATSHFNRQYAPYLECIPLPGMSGIHTVKVQLWAATGPSSYVNFCWAASPASGPEVFVGNVPYMTAAGYAAYGGNNAIVDSYSAAIAEVVTLLAAGGLDVKLRNHNGAVTLADLQADGLHYLDSGHDKIAALSAVPAPAPSPAPPSGYTFSVATVYERSDGKYFVGTAPTSKELATVPA